MPTIREHLESTEATDIIGRLRELWMDPSATHVSIDFLKASDEQLRRILATPYQSEYKDGIELWLRWFLQGDKNLEDGEPAVGVFGVYLSESNQLWVYYVQNIIPSKEDLVH